MKSLFLILLTVLSTNVMAITVDCSVDYANGDVFLTYTHEGPEAQKFQHYVGRESFLDPYKVRNLCAQARNEITEIVKSEWHDDGCDPQNTGRRFFTLVETLKLTANGKTLLGQKEDTLLFIPVNPAEGSFTKFEYDNACDWY